MPDRLRTQDATSYDRWVYIEITADRDAVPDVDVLAQCMGKAPEELVDTAADAGPDARDPRGRVRPVPDGGGTPWNRP